MAILEPLKESFVVIVIVMNKQGEIKINFKHGKVLIDPLIKNSLKVVIFCVRPIIIVKQDDPVISLLEIISRS